MSRFQLHIRSALFLAIAAATAIATLAPVLSLRGSLAPAAVRTVGLGFSLTPTAQDAASLQGLATARLLSLLIIIAACACAVAVVTLLTLTWTRGEARAIDVPIRRAVGASRRTLAFGFLGEAAAITCSAVPVGLLLGGIALRIASRSWPGQPVPLSFAGAVVAIPVALALVGGSLLPLRHARGRRLVNLPANPLGLFPPVLQVGVSLGILLSATLVSKQAMRLIGPGNTAPDGTVYELAARDADPAQRAAQYLDLLRDLEHQGVTASLTSPGMMLGLGTVDWVETDCGQCLTGGFYLKWHNERATHHLVSPDTFSVLGMPVVSGRAFTLADDWSAPRVAIVNRQMAARHFQDGEPLGRMIFVGKERIPYTVVGVVDDGGAVGLTGGIQSRFAIYLSSLQVPIAAADLTVQGHDAGTAALAALARTSLSRDAGSSIAEVRQRFTAPLMWFSRWIRVEAIAALLAGALGAMVSIAIWANALVPELAIHRAIGATRRRVVLHVLLRVLLIVGAGVGAALFAMAPSLRAVLSEVLGDLPELSLGATVVPGVLLALAAFLGAIPPVARLLNASPMMQPAE